MKQLLIAVLLLGLLPAQRMNGQLQLSLEDAHRYAIEHAFEVKNSRLEAEVASREVKETLSQGLPQLNGSLEYNNFIDIPVQVAQGDVFALPSFLNNFLGGVSQATGVPINAPPTDPDAISEFQFGANQTVTAGVQASQLIFDGAYFVGLRASRAYAEAMREGIRQTEAEVKKAVSEAYHMVLVANENTRILKDSRELLESSFNDTKALFENGFVEELDVDQLELSLADLDSRIRYSELQAEATLDLLKFRMGLKLSEPVQLTNTIDQLVEANDPILLEKSFDAMSLPEYRVQQNYVKLANLGVKLERTRLMPSINGFYTYQRNAQRFEFDFFDSDQKWYPIQLWGVQMNIPIFGSGLARHRIEKSKIELLRAEAALERIEEGSRLEYRTSRIEFDNAIEQRGIQQKNLRLAERIFERTQVKFSEGVTSSLELTQVRNQLLTAQGNYIGATLEVLNARVRLNKALNNL